LHYAWQIVTTSSDFSLKMHKEPFDDWAVQR